MSNIYISSWSKPLALAAKSSLEDAGHEVVSVWHDGEAKRSADRKPEEMRLGAERNVDLIIQADALLLLVAPDLSPGGTYVEAGVAIGVGTPVVAVGLRENCSRGNNMLYHTDVAQYDRVEDAVADIEEIIDKHVASYDDDVSDFHKKSECRYYVGDGVWANQDPCEGWDDNVKMFDENAGSAFINTSDITVSPDTMLGCGCKAGERCGEGSETDLQDD